MVEHSLCVKDCSEHFDGLSHLIFTTNHELTQTQELGAWI